ASLAEVFERAKKPVLARSEDGFTAIAIELLDMNKYTQQQARYKQNRDMLSITHSFVMAVGKEGIRILQSFSNDPKLPLYTFDQYIDRGGARLRSWKEANIFVENFKILLDLCGKYIINCQFSYKDCFEIDLSAAVANRFTKKTKSIAPTYAPFIRLHKMPNLKSSDLKKFQWDWTCGECNLRDDMKELSETHGHLTPEQCGIETKILYT
ncbi:hypothetical protein EJ08DRAFT_600005, partial [Tothia fuscella]